MPVFQGSKVIVAHTLTVVHGVHHAPSIGDRYRQNSQVAIMKERAAVQTNPRPYKYKYVGGVAASALPALLLLYYTITRKLF